MIITDKFVMINLPKTGTQFTRNILTKVHGKHSVLDNFQYFLGLKKRPHFQNLYLPNIRTTSMRKGSLNEHGICDQIPEEHRKKEIVSIKRNVFSRYISLYEYSDWKVAPWIDLSIVKESYPSYPDLSFEEFVHYMIQFNPTSYLPEIDRKLPVGPLTSQYILFYFKNSFKVLQEIDQEYLDNKKYLEDRYKVHFLDQTNLNQDLYDYLLSMDYEKDAIEFILKEPKRNNSTPKNKGIDDYFSEDLKNLVYKEESLLFELNALNL